MSLNRHLLILPRTSAFVENLLLRKHHHRSKDLTIEFPLFLK